MPRLGARKGDWLPFEEARAYARTLNFRSSVDWAEFPVPGGRPHNIPSDPRGVYTNEWKGWADWLGYEEGTRSPNKMARLPAMIKLSQERPDLFERFKKSEMSLHAAMEEAGFN